MKLLLSLLSLIIYCSTYSQKPAFPASWSGDWKGEVNWFKTGESTPSKVSMELKIHPTLTKNVWTWQIVYGGAGEDERPYKLLPKDSSGTHWLIDENNGIVLDQYWVADKLCGMFTVGNSTIINNYWREGDSLIVEFYSVAAKPIATTGEGSKNSPKVDSYQVAGYQKAVLTRQY